MSGYTRLLKQATADEGDPVEQRAARADFAELKRYADRWMDFVEDRLGIRLLGYQRRIFESVLESEQTAVLSCNAAGKDLLAAVLSMFFSYVLGAVVVIQSASMRQVRSVVFREIQRLFHGSDLPGKLYRTSLRIPDPAGYAGIIGMTSTSASRLGGWHAPRVLYVLSEAQGIDRDGWSAMRGVMAGDEDRVLAIGNPLASSEPDFRQACSSDDWAVHQIAAADVIEAQEQERRIPGLLTQRAVDRIRSAYGEGHPEYVSRVLARFPESAEFGLISRAWLDRAADLKEAGAFLAESGREEPIVSVDPARYGPDLTCVAVRRGPILQSLEWWAKTDTVETVSKIRDLASRAGVSAGIRQNIPHKPGKWTWYRRPYGRVVVDEVGLGGPIIDMLKQEQRLAMNRTAVLRVDGFNSSRKPSQDRDALLNRRSEAYVNLARLLENGEIALPKDEELFSELSDMRWSVRAGDGKTQIEPKDGMKARLGRSPDRADAVAQAFAPETGGRRVGVFSFSV